MAEVAALAAAGRLPDATLDKDGLRITPIRAELPLEAKRFAADAYALLPRIRITDLLLEVDGWTGFSGCFTHARSGRPAPDRAALLTAVLADGINLGLTRMAESCRGPTLRQLAWTHDWHVREECYAAALARLIEVHRALPLAAAWGDGTTSSSDGQFFRAGGRGEAVGDVNAGHGNEPGVAFYTHASPTSSGRSTRRSSPPPPPRHRMCSTACCATAPACASPSTTPTPAARPTRSSASSRCSASASRRACAI